MLLFSNWTGCARVEGDEEEEDVDDLENEFNFDGNGRSRQDMLQQQQPESMLHYGGAFDSHLLQPLPQLPLLTNGQMVP